MLICARRFGKPLADVTPKFRASLSSDGPAFLTINDNSIYELPHPRQPRFFNRPDARPQSRSFARRNQSLGRNPNSNRLWIIDHVQRGLFARGGV